MPYDKKGVSTKDHSPVKSILVVEDDAANGACIAEMIVQETPYHVLLVPTSPRALEIVRHIKPNLFIFDYRLPQMNGVQLFDHLHALPELEDVPALILTACLEDCEAEIETRKLIALRKPFDMDEFLLNIKEMLERPTDSSSRQPVLVP
jgi:DNA-binding response OmpR family regulator